MHYRHSFHAGNFADVHKHVALTGLLQALNNKDKPWCYLDTHAGAGMYSLASEAASRTGEAGEGILRLQNVRNPPPMVAAYLASVAAHNPGAEVLHYPGSPMFAARATRATDRVVLCETVVDVSAELRVHLSPYSSRVIIHGRDGYEAASLLPPVEKRGLTLIDPPFERIDEAEAMITFCKAALTRFSGGIIAAWYPLKSAHAVERFLRRLSNAVNQPLSDFQLQVRRPADGKISGSGLVVINPPFGFAEQMAEAQNFLLPLLKQDSGARVSVTVLRAQP